MNFVEIIRDEEGRYTLYESNGVADMVIGYADTAEDAERQAEETGMRYTPALHA